MEGGESEMSQERGVAEADWTREPPETQFTGDTSYQSSAYDSLLAAEAEPEFKEGESGKEEDGEEEPELRYPAEYYQAKDGVEAVDQDKIFDTQDVQVKDRMEVEGGEGVVAEEALEEQPSFLRPAVAGIAEATHLGSFVLSRNASAESSSREPAYESDAVVDPVVEQAVEVAVGPGVVFKAVAASRAGSKYPCFSYAGYTYSINKPEPKLDKPLAEQRWVLRCVNYKSMDCKMKVAMTGDYKLHPGSTLPIHVCRSGQGAAVKKQIQSDIREMVTEKMEVEAKYWRFQSQVHSIYKRYSDVELKNADYPLDVAVKFAYDFARNKCKLPRAPTTIHYEWPEKDLFLQRDLGHTGEKKSILLFDSGVFNFVSARKVAKEGRFACFGSTYVRKFLHRCDGALFDGTYYTCPINYAQVFSVMLRVVLSKDSDGKPQKIAYVCAVSAVLSSHDFEVYLKFFLWLKDWLGDWEPEFCMSDYEKAAAAAFRKAYAAVPARLGCKYHLSNAQRTWLSKNGLLRAVMDECRSRRQIRFVVALAYVPVELVGPIFRKFLNAIQGSNQKSIFQTSNALKYMMESWVGFPMEDGGFKEGRYKHHSWNRHEATKLGWPTTSNCLESMHRVLRLHTGPSPGLWSFADLMGLMFELTRGRLRKLEQLMHLVDSNKDVDTMLDSYDIDVEELKRSGFDVEALESIGEVSPVKASSKISSSQRWIRGVSETSVRRLKENPLTVDFVKGKVGEEVKIKTGYQSIGESREGMELPFESLEHAVRCWPAYATSEDLQYLFVRKCSCLVDTFGQPRPFCMTPAERLVFTKHAANWDSTAASFGGSDDEEDGALSDTGDVVEDVKEELRIAARRESLASGLLKRNEAKDGVVDGEEKAEKPAEKPAKKPKKIKGKKYGKNGDVKTDFSSMDKAEVQKVKKAAVPKARAVVESESDEDAPLSVYSPTKKRRSGSGECSKASEPEPAKKKAKKAKKAKKDKNEEKEDKEQDLAKENEVPKKSKKRRSLPKVSPKMLRSHFLKKN